MIAALLLVTAAATAPAPSLVMLGVMPKAGFPADTAELIGETIVAELRGSGHFARISTVKDLETVVGVERQRQLLHCDDTSCLVEIAGALNVDLVLTGSVGRVGESYVFSLRIVSARSGQAAATVTERLRGTGDDVLLDRVKPMTATLIAQLQGAAPTELREVAPPPAAQDDEAPRLRVPLLAGGAGVGGLGVLLALVALVPLGVGAAVATASVVPGLPLPPGGFTGRIAIIVAGLVGGGGTLGLGLAGVVVGAVLVVLARVL